MKRWHWLLIFVVLIVILFLTFRLQEDTWIIDSRGIWVEHGHPSYVPEEVKEQQILLNKTLELYAQKKIEFQQQNISFSSQCLGLVEQGNITYAIDIVHVPRNHDDTLPENQCSDYPSVASHFIEIDKDGNVIRIV
jgi:hypothetical protein